MTRRLIKCLLVLVLVAGIVRVVVWYRIAKAGLSKAQELAELKLWSGAREELELYLWLYPKDEEAHFLIAEALVKDEELPTSEAVHQAIEHLQTIDDDSPNAVTARIRESLLRLLILRQPARCETVLKRAIELDPNSFQAHYLHWKVLDLTGRSHLAETPARKAYELSPDHEKSIRLREWYMSQFYPATANPALDAQMGFAEEAHQRKTSTEVIRLKAFRDSEPDAPLSHAALARGFFEEGEPEPALEILKAGMNSLNDALQDAYFVATLVAVCFELGKFEEAEAYFELWPLPHEGYEYWQWRAIVEDQIRGDLKEAIQYYDKAFAIWPGPVEWRLQNRKANCLRRMGKHEEAQQLLLSSKAVEELTHEKVHTRLRDNLGYLNDPEKMSEVAAFYEKLGCSREAKAWRLEIERLQSNAPLQGAIGVTNY